MDNDSVPHDILNRSITVIRLEITPVCAIQIKMLVRNVGDVCARAERAYSGSATQVAVDVFDKEIVRGTFDGNALVSVRHL